MTQDSRQSTQDRKVPGQSQGLVECLPSHFTNWHLTPARHTRKFTDGFVELGVMTGLPEVIFSTFPTVFYSGTFRRPNGIHIFQLL